MQLGTAGDFSDNTSQNFGVLTTRISAAWSELLRISKLVLFDPRRRFEQDEVSVSVNWQHRKRDGQGYQETQPEFHLSHPTGASDCPVRRIVAALAVPPATRPTP
jgi:hypothetical protein